MSAWHPKGNLAFTVAQHTDAGIKSDNEDAIGIRIPEGPLLHTKGAVAVIADGISAAEAGKEASETCVRNFLVDYFSTPDTWTVKKSTSQVLIALNRWLYSRGRTYHDAQKGYVSTFSCAIFKSHTLYTFHVGDSRIYRYRNKNLEQLTRDHRTHISNKDSYLVRAMGLDVSLDVDCGQHALEAGDLFLLTTDGIHDFVSPSQITDILTTAHKDMNEACQQLAQLATSNNSDDNISCQLIRVDSLPEENIADATQKLTELPFPPTFEHGQVIDGFRIEKELHANSRSQVYLVTDLQSNQQYCMKTPSINYNDDNAYIERFILESWIGTRISNSHVVKIFTPNRAKSYLYYLMEYIEGITLKQWIIQNPKPSMESVLYIVEQAIKGIRAFHRRETFHQDIRPANIMIDRNGEVKIIDFGACFIKGIAEIASPIKRDDVLGTAEYSAPEHVLGGEKSEQSDIFSLAVVIFEMLTGEHPFKGKLSQCRTAKAYLNTQYTPSYELNPLIPFWVDGAIKKGLRFDPARRHGDISEFLHELTHPNPKYKQRYKAILSNKKPERVWQYISAALFIALCCVSYALSQQISP